MCTLPQRIHLLVYLRTWKSEEPKVYSIRRCKWILRPQASIPPVSWYMQHRTDEIWGMRKRLRMWDRSGKSLNLLTRREVWSTHDWFSLKNIQVLRGNWQFRVDISPSPNREKNRWRIFLNEQKKCLRRAPNLVSCWRKLTFQHVIRRFFIPCRVSLWFVKFH